MSARAGLAATNPTTARAIRGAANDFMELALSGKGWGRRVNIPVRAFEVSGRVLLTRPLRVNLKPAAALPRALGLSSSGGLATISPDMSEPTPSGPRPGHHPLWLLALTALIAWQAWMALALFGPNDPWQALTNDEPLLAGRHPLHLYHGYLGARALLE